MFGKLKPQERLYRAISEIDRDGRYLAMKGVFMTGTRVVDPECPTACTNGRDEWYGTKWIDSVCDAELRGGVVHENYHKGLCHCSFYEPYRKKDPQVFNMAGDYVINLIIKDENPPEPNYPKGFCAIGDGWLIDEQYRDMSVVEVFNSLYEDKDQGQGKFDPDNNDGTPQSGETFDSHVFDPNVSPQGDEPEAGGDDEPLGGYPALSDDEKKTVSQEIKDALRQGELVAGKVGGKGHNKIIEDLLKPQINWRTVLRDYIATTCEGDTENTYNRLHRRFIGRGIVMPSTYDEQVGELLLANDLSYSCWNILPYFMTEVQQIVSTVRPECARVMYWDHEVQGDELFVGEEIDALVQNTKPVGGGGTVPACVPNHLRDNKLSPQCAIVFTDGEVYAKNDWGTWDCPVLWCILDNPNCVPPCGSVLHIKSEDMKK